MIDVRTICGFGVSAGVHTVLIGALALGTIGPPPEEAPPMLVVSQWASHDSVESVQFELPAPPQATCPFPVVAPPTADPIAVTAGHPDGVLDGDLPEPADDAAWGLGLPGGMLSGSGGGGGIERGGATFFGTTVPGTRFVYVVDASRSMAGNRFRKAKHELVRSVSNLRPDQQLEIRVVISYKENILLLPNGPYYRDRGYKDMYVIRGNKAYRTAVLLGDANFDYVEILEGLQEGDRVILSDIEEKYTRDEIRVRK